MKKKIRIRPAPINPPRRRQQRGYRRLNQLLDAADAVFAEIGYERATTNAISKHAGVSPGTFYQFFPNKRAVAEALAARYVEQLQEIHRTAFAVAAVNIPLPELINRVVDPFINLHRQGSCLEALLTGSVISEELSSSIEALDHHVEVGLENLFIARRPKADRTELKRAASTCVQLFKALLHPALNGSPRQQRQGTQELKTVFFRYLAPVLGEGRAVTRRIGVICGSTGLTLDKSSTDQGCPGGPLRELGRYVTPGSRLNVQFLQTEE